MQSDETIHHRILFREDGVGTAASQLRSQFKYQFCSGDGISCGSRGKGLRFTLKDLQHCLTIRLLTPKGG